MQIWNQLIPLKTCLILEVKLANDPWTKYIFYNAIGQKTKAAA